MDNTKRLTRKQINERLEQLRESWADEESYFITQGSNAMCYMVDFEREPKFDTLKCGKCGKEFQVKQGTTYGYDRITTDFCKVGMDAKFVCHCEDCVNTHALYSYEIWIKAQDETAWHKSYPQIGRDYDGVKWTAKRTSNFEYGLVLDFLRAQTESIDLPKFFADFYNVQFRKTEKDFFKSKPVLDFSEVETVQDGLDLIGSDCGGFIYNRCMSLFAEKFKALTYKGINGESYTHESQDAGFIKTQIDWALSKVLGLEIIYELAEVKRNIAFLFESREMVEFIDQAIEFLLEERKTAFTVWKYSEFMDSVYPRLQYPKDKASEFLDEIISAKIAYQGSMHSAVMEIADKWLASSKKQTFSKIELERYVVDELIPNGRISTKEVREVFVREFNVPYMAYCLDEFADIKKLDKKDRQKVLEASGFVEPLKCLGGKEAVSLAEIEKIQEQVSERIKSTVAKWATEIHIVHMGKTEGADD